MSAVRAARGPIFCFWNAHARKIRKKLYKNFSDEMKILFFIEDTHLPQMISKCISIHLITGTANEKPREQN
jgi:hypothetical protein